MEVGSVSGANFFYISVGKSMGCDLVLIVRQHVG